MQGDAGKEIHIHQSSKHDNLIRDKIETLINLMLLIKDNDEDTGKLHLVQNHQND